MTLAVLCPGQGGQHGAMLDLVADEPAGAVALDAAGSAAGFDLRAALHGDGLFENAVAQPLICAAQCITWSLLAPRLAAAGVAATLFAGYSVGELAAHGCAGSIAVGDVIALARRRAALMDAAGVPGCGLVALRGITRRTVDGLCSAHHAHLAIANGDDHWVVGGCEAALAAVERDADAIGASVHRLPVAIAAHTPLLAAAAKAFQGPLGAVAWTRAGDIIAGVDGSVVRDASAAVETLSRQIAQTIRWSACMDSIAERGATVSIELGPGDALSRMMRERHPRIAVRSLADFRTLDAAAAWVIGQSR
jgi:[acyl-carrier-protein] S-malonyltransferase